MFFFLNTDFNIVILKTSTWSEYKEWLPAHHTNQLIRKLAPARSLRKLEFTDLVNTSAAFVRASSQPLYLLKIILCKNYFSSCREPRF